MKVCIIKLLESASILPESASKAESIKHNTKNANSYFYDLLTKNYFITGFIGGKLLASPLLKYTTDSLINYNDIYNNSDNTHKNLIDYYFDSFQDFLSNFPKTLITYGCYHSFSIPGKYGQANQILICKTITDLSIAIYSSNIDNLYKMFSSEYALDLFATAFPFVLSKTIGIDKAINIYHESMLAGFLSASLGDIIGVADAIYENIIELIGDDNKNNVNIDLSENADL